MRNLASIQKINNIEPIPNADSIEKITVLGWELVAKKGEFRIGDLCVYCEIDSILPEKPEFEFLRDRKFRIKTIKLRGQISQGICFPLSILPENIKIKEGLDVTEILGIEKFEPYEEEQKMCKQVNKIGYPNWMPKWMHKILHRFKFFRIYYRKTSGQKSFPSLIPKTDETRVQVLQKLLDKYIGTECYYSEKLDGSSITVYQINGKFGVCSRNIDLKRNKNDKYWKAVLSYDLENKFKKYFKNENIAIQGELIGEGIQGNKYKLSGHHIYFFNILYIQKRIYGNIECLKYVCNLLDINIVPILNEHYILTNDIPSLVELSKGNSELYPNSPREGIVIRPLQEIEDFEFRDKLVKNRISFKSINPEFLLKYGI